MKTAKHGSHSSARFMIEQRENIPLRQVLCAGLHLYRADAVYRSKDAAIKLS